MASLRKKAVRGAKFVRGSLFVESGHRLDDCVFVLGSGRSGTTWLADLLGLEPAARSIFEPFDPRRVRAVSAFRYREYLRPDDRRPELRNQAERVLTGRFRSVWSDGENRAVHPTRRVVKEIRACLFAGWLRSEFPDLAMVYIVRNPYLNAGSRVKLGWPHSLTSLLDQEALRADYPDLVRVVDGARSPFARHVGAWAIDNTVALDQLRAVGIPVVMTDHERLVSAFPTELDTVRGACGLAPITAVPPALIPQAPATVGGRVTAEALAARLRLSLADVAEAQALLGSLQIGELYGDAWSTDRTALAGLT